MKQKINISRSKDVKVIQAGRDVHYYAEQTMPELIFNGLNLAGSLSSIGSLAVGFSLEKNLRQIESSVRRLEELYANLLNASRLQSVVHKEVAPLISGFSKIADPKGQDISMRAINKYFNELRTDLTSETTNILQTALLEMQRTLQAVHFTEGRPVGLKSNIYRGLVNDPYEAGVTRYGDISEGGLWARKDRKIITPQIVPITWGNPVTGQMFLGEIPLTRLGQYGFQVRVPKYKHVVDGHVYCEKRGLYLPSYLVE